jgi:hypothetical protein
VTKAADPQLVKFLGISQASQGKHSKLYHWLREHHAAISYEFSLHGAQWAKRVEVLAELGLTDRTGKPPTVQRAQKTWYRVCQDIERAGGNHLTRAAALKNASVPEPERLPLQPPAAASKPAKDSCNPPPAMPREPEVIYEEEEPLFRTSGLKTYE